MTGGRRSLRPIVGALAVALVAACSSPDPALYMIAPASGATQTAGPKVVLLKQIALARYLDRSQIVRSSENYRLEVMSNDWWGEPLSSMLSRILVEELSQRLPESTVLSDSGSVSFPPDAVIELNVQRVDEDAAGTLVLHAQAGVNVRGRGAPALRSFRITVPVSGAGVSGEVAAISAAIGQLADGLASMLLAGSSGA